MRGRDTRGVDRRAGILLAALLLGAGLLSAPRARAVIQVEGDIAADAVWTPAEEYLVTNDTTVLPGVTLTVLAGTTVRFRTVALPTIGVSLIVRGTLRILGSSAQPVLLTSDSPTPTRGDWEALRFVDTTGSEIDHAIVEYARFALDLRNASVHVDHSQLLDSLIAGVHVLGPGSAPLIENSLISAKGFENITLNERLGAVVDEGSPIFRNLTVSDNNFGFLVTSPQRVVIEGSEIRDGWRGITAVDANLTVRNNLLRRNGLPGFGGSGIDLFSGTDAVLEGNVLVDNGVGTSIDYPSRRSVIASSNNTVNGFRLEELYYVDRHDERIRDRVFDAGRSAGHVGDATWEGHLTVYDSTNLTFENVSVGNNVLNANVVSENSTFALVNSTLLWNSSRDLLVGGFSDVHLANVVFRASAVEATDEYSRVWVENFVRAQVLTDLGEPMAGATASVLLGTAAYDTARAGADGHTRWLRGTQGFFAKVAGQALTSYTRFSPVLEVALPQTEFHDNPRPLALDQPRTEVFVRKDVTPPTVASLLPGDGALDVARDVEVQIVFSEPMDTASVAAALAVPGAITNLSWGDGNRTLRFTLTGLSPGQTYVLQVSSEARDTAGNRLLPVTATFTTARLARTFEVLPVALVAMGLLAVGLGLLAVGRRRSGPGDAAGEEKGGDGGEGKDGGREGGEAEGEGRPREVPREEVQGDGEHD